MLVKKAHDTVDDIHPFLMGEEMCRVCFGDIPFPLSVKVVPTAGKIFVVNTILLFKLSFFDRSKNLKEIVTFIRDHP